MPQFSGKCKGEGMENLQVTIETGKLQGIHGWDPRIAEIGGAHV